MVGWFALSIQPIPEGVLILSSDITERVRAEKQVARMKRLYATLSQVNQTIVRVKEAGELYQSICNVAVQFGEFSLAWIGLLDEAAGNVNPAAANGLDVRQWPFPTINIHTGRLKNGLVARSIRTSKVMTSEDIQTDKSIESIKNLHELIHENNYHSLAVVPFRLRDRTIGVLSLVSREVGLFEDQEEVHLLEEMALDISFALDTMETERIKRQWADAFEHCAHGIAIGLPSTNHVLTCNPAFARPQDRSIEEISSTPILSMYAPQDHEQVKQAIAESDRKGSSRFEAHMVRKDGTIYPVQMDLVSVCDVNGNLLYRVATQQNISERKRAEEKLQASEHMLKLFVEYAPAAIAMFDRAMNYIAVSRRYISDYRLADENVVGRSHYEVFPEIPERWKEIHKRCLAGAIEKADEDPFLRIDGSLDWVRWEIHPWYERSGEIGGIVLFSEVITERKTMEEAILERERQMKALVTSLDDIVFEFDEKGTYLNVWAADESLLAQPKDQILGRRIEEILGEENGRLFAEAVRRVLRSGHSESIEYPLEVISGQRWFVARISPILALDDDAPRTVSMLIRDITEQKQAQERLRKSEERFRRYFELGLIGMAITSPTKGILEVNDQICAILGYQRNELLQMTWAEITHPDDLTLDNEQFNQVMAGECDGYSVDKRWIRKDGQVIYSTISVKCIRRTDGSVDYFIALLQDITERQEAEKALRESETRFRSLIENSSEEVSIVTTDGKLLYESPSANPTLGYPSGEFLGQSLFQLIHPDDFERIQDHLARLIQDPNLHPRDQFRLRHQNGSWVWVEAVGTNLLSEPSVGGIVINYHDITERKQAEETLRVSENRFRLASKATNDVIWEWNAKTRELTWTENAQIVFGYSPDEIGPDEKWWDEHIHPDDRERIVSKMEALIAGNESIWADEYHFRRLDGTYAYISDRSYIEREASGEAIRMVGAMSDISERKQAEEQVQLQLSRLSALSEIDRAISSSLDMRLSLEVLLHEVLSQLGVDAASVLLLNETDLTLRYLAGKGFRTLAIRQSRVRLSDGGAGKVGLERKLLHVTSLAEDSSNFLRADLLQDEEFVEYFGVPLVAKGALKGVLEIFHRTLLNPDLEWINYLETLGGQAAIAIDNAQLFEDVRQSNMELIAAYDATIVGWSHAMDLRDKETEGHSQRVTELTLKLAKQMGVSEQDQVHIRRGALLHDIGKLGIPDHILLKSGKLTKGEWVLMRKHPKLAYEMLAPVAYLRPALDIPYCHHEKWDGTGYPRGLKGEQIPQAARIFAVADVWDALTSDRPYRKAWTREKTLQYIQEQSGRHFDPDVVAVFLKTFR